MLSRLLPILSLIAAGVLGWSLYTSGTLNELFSPNVSVVVTKRVISEGEHVRANAILMREIKAKDIEPGMITFPAGASAKEAETALANQQAGQRIEKNEAMTSSMLGKKSNYVILRTTMEVEEGESITLRNVEATPLKSAPRPGVIIFDTEDQALSYVNETYDLAAREMLPHGEILTVEATAGGAEKVFVVRAARGFDRAETLAMDGLEVTEISSRDLPRGAIAFPSASAANVFTTAADRYVAAESLRKGGFITAEVIASDNGLAPLPSGDLPRTMAELTAYMTAFPDSAMIIDGAVMLDKEPTEGGSIDMWIEDGRTGTGNNPFGEIRLKRLAGDVELRIVYLDEATGEAGTEEEGSPLPDDLASPTAPVQPAAATDEDEAEARIAYWIKAEPEKLREFQKAWRAPDSIAFMIHNDVNLVDEIGNGATCQDGYCSINRKASSDMADVIAQLEPPAPEPGAMGGTGGSPLMILDTVDADLAARFAQNGYPTLADIAAIPDPAMATVQMQVNISLNRLSFIRRQAELILASSDIAREELGMGDTVTE